MTEAQHQPLRRLASFLLSVLLFWLLGSYARISTGVNGVYIFLQYPLLCLTAWFNGPLTGLMTGAVGHALINLTVSGFVRPPWVIGSALIGLLMGLGGRRWPGMRPLRFSLCCAAAVFASTGVITPLLNLLLTPGMTAAEAFRQGLFAALSDALTTVVAAQLVFGASRHTAFRKVVALAVLVDALLLFSYSRQGFGNFAVYILAVLTGLYALTGDFFRRHARGGGYFALQYCVTAAAVLLALMLIFLMLAGYTGGATGSEQAIIVLGAGLDGDQPNGTLRARLDRAAEFAEAHPQTPIVVSGGQGDDEILPEAEAMKNYLVSQKGIDEGRILTESRSTITEENFAFSLALLESVGLTADTPVAYVTSDYHCYRAGLYAKLAGLTAARAIPAPTSVASLLPALLRECPALVKLVWHALRQG